MDVAGRAIVLCEGPRLGELGNVGGHSVEVAGSIHAPFAVSRSAAVIATLEAESDYCNYFA